MSQTIQLCKCVKPKLVFKKYVFTNARVAYRATCTSCGLLKGWYAGKNYKLVKGGVTVTK